MSSLIFSLPAASAATGASSSAGSSTAAARGRDPQERSDADGFGAALARSRDARTRSTEDKSDTTTSSAAPGSRRRGSAADAEKDKSPAELLAMALLTPAFGAQQRQAAAQGEASAGRALSDGIARDPLASAAAAMAQPDATPASDTDMPADAVSAQTADARAGAKDDKLAKAPVEVADDKTRTASPAAAVPAAPVAVLPVGPQGTPATPTNSAPDAKPSVAATSAVTTKAAPEVQAATSAHAEEASLADSHDSQPDTPTTLPGALNFKAALAEANGASSTTQAQSLPRFNVPTPVGSEGWGADIGTQMIRMGADGHHVAELSLNPAGLGPLKVTLTLGDNQAQAMFVSAHESVRRAVEAALPQLRDTLAGQGIQLGQASVDAGTQQQQAFGQERGFEGSQARPSTQRESQRQVATADSAPLRSTSGTRAGSGIDTFA